jgi:hypothetical protein
MAKTRNKEERAARQRELQRAAEVRRRRGSRTRVLRVAGGVVLTLAILAAAFVYFGRSGGSNGTAVAASATLGPLTAAKPSGSTGSFHRVSAPYRVGGKPVLLFVGAQYCPFCAAERWAVVKALSRFGSWSGLAAGHSSSGESGFGDVPTYVLLQARYHSLYVAFDHKDVADNAGNTLQHLSPVEQTYFNRYDPAGSIPLVYVDGYAMSGSGYSPAELQGGAFAHVQSELRRNGNAPYVGDINGEANLLTAFLCHGDGNRPQTACKSPVIRSIERSLR